MKNRRQSIIYIYIKIYIYFKIQQSPLLLKCMILCDVLIQIQLVFLPAFLLGFRHLILFNFVEETKFHIYLNTLASLLHSLEQPHHLSPPHHDASTHPTSEYSASFSKSQPKYYLFEESPHILAFDTSKF